MRLTLLWRKLTLKCFCIALQHFQYFEVLTRETNGDWEEGEAPLKSSPASSIHCPPPTPTTQIISTIIIIVIIIVIIAHPAVVVNYNMESKIITFSTSPLHQVGRSSSCCCQLQHGVQDDHLLNQPSPSGWSLIQLLLSTTTWSPR